MTDFISIEKVYGILEDAIAPEALIESFPLEKALGRILAETLTSPGDVPPFNNSAMDGFAFKSDELQKGGTVRLLVKEAHSLSFRPNACAPMKTSASAAKNSMRATPSWNPASC